MWTLLILNDRDTGKIFVVWTILVPSLSSSVVCGKLSKCSLLFRLVPVHVKCQVNYGYLCVSLVPGFSGCPYEGVDRIIRMTNDGSREPWNTTDMVNATSAGETSPLKVATTGTENMDTALTHTCSPST